MNRARPMYLVSDEQEIDTTSDDVSLKNGGGGGNSGGMETRIAHLEDSMKEVKTDLKNIRERLARLEGEVSRLPGYGGIAVIVGLIVALSTAVQIGTKFIP